MKRTLAFVLVVILVMNVVACSSNSAIEQVETSTIEIIEPSSVEKETTTMQEMTTEAETTTVKETTTETETTTVEETTTEVETTTEEIPEASIEPKDDVTKKDITIPEEINTKSNYSTAYNKEAEVKNRTVVYFGKPRKFDSKGTNWESSNNAVATVDANGNVTTWSEGIADITCSDSNGNVVDTFKIYATTFNDGRDIRTATTWVKGREVLNDNDELFFYGGSAEQLKNEINTIRDLIAYLCQRKFYYNFDMPICATKSCWTWAVEGDAVLELGYGVCCDIANVASYVLQYDYEELGFIYTIGDGVGHVFNYVYEDGYYYVFDLTEVICDNTRDYRQFSILRFEKLEELLDHTKVNLNDPDYVSRLLAVVVVDSLNHEEQPALHESFMKKSSYIYTHEKLYIGFEEGVPYEVIYENKDGIFAPVEWVSVPTDELPNDVMSWFEEEHSAYRY